MKRSILMVTTHANHKLTVQRSSTQTISDMPNDEANTRHAEYFQEFWSIYIIESSSTKDTRIHIPPYLLAILLWSSEAGSEFHPL